MTASRSALLLPGYLLLCLLLGGSQRDIWPNAVLQLLAVLLIGFAVLRDAPEPLTRASKQLLTLILAGFVIVLLQVVPLPPGLWSNLPGRAGLHDSYDLLGGPLPWLPVSLAPYSTVDSLTWCLPPLAILIGYVRLRPPATMLCAAAVLAGAFAGVMLGALQVTSGPDWHLYRITNSGAVGFFANRNFMGTLLLVSIPFTIAWLADAPRKATTMWAMRTLGAAAMLVVIVGLALNRSMAALMLSVPVAIASAMLLHNSARFARYVVPAAALAAILAISLVTNSPVGSEFTGADTTSVASRASIWASTLRAIGDSFPVGTGLGSFEAVYATFENPDLVDRTFINNVHNDYLQLALEMGIFGVVLIAAFLGWWAMLASKIWRSASFSAMTRAAVIASGVILFHSVVDYPLRTSAIAAVFALCLGMMAQPAEARTDRSGAGVQRARHVKIG